MLDCRNNAYVLLLWYRNHTADAPVVDCPYFLGEVARFITMDWARIVGDMQDLDCVIPKGTYYNM